MNWQNAYAPPSPTTFSAEDLYGFADKPYDLNFCFPITPEHCTKTLTNASARVRLEPFLPRVHGAPCFAAFAKHPELFDWMPLACPTSLEEMLGLFATIFQRDSKNVLFAVMVPKPYSNDGSDDGEWQLAGTMGLIYASPMQMSAELGLAVTFPAFQRTHVTSNAIGLALRYCLNLPTDTSAPGIGLRRAQWQANILNVASTRAAERLGFRQEGVLRWTWPLPEGRSGHEPRAGDAHKEKKGRDSVYLGLCCDDWESSGREKVEAAMRIRGT